MLILGAAAGCLRTGCAQLGIFISTCRGFAYAESTELLRVESVLASVALGGSLSLDVQVEKEPLLDFGGDGAVEL